MGIVEEKAIKFAERKIKRSPIINKFLSELDEELLIYRYKDDEVKYITKVFEIIQFNNIEHAKICEEPKTCSKTIFLKEAEYFVNQMVKDLGVGLNSEEIFNESDRLESNSKIDKIIEEIEVLKKGQELIYNDLSFQLEELKELYFLGKRNWRQLFIGKITEMTISGVVSESLSKEIISIAGLVAENIRIQ